MQENNPGPEQFGVMARFRQQITSFRPRLPLLLIVSVLVVATLACGFARSDGQPAAERGLMLTRLPTLTPTALPTLTPTVNANNPESATTSAPVALSTPLPEATNASVASGSTNLAGPASEAANTLGDDLPLREVILPAPDVETPGWSVNGVRVYQDQYGDGLLLYGNITNNTGTSQALDLVTGNFYNDQGQLVADEESTIDYWPIDVIPPGGRSPFELTVDGAQSVSNFSLSVEAEPSDQTPRQDFEFLDLTQWNEDGAYCLAGRLRNPGNVLEEYLMIVVVLYDAQDEVIKFGDYYEPYPQEVTDSQPLDFELCVDSTGQDVARHELVAWGG